MRARRLAASAALGWVIAGAPAWAYPVEIYRCVDMGLGGTAALCGVVLVPTLLVLAIARWERRWLRWVFLLLALAAPVALVLAYRSRSERVVVAVSARELRVDLHRSGVLVGVGRELIPVARVRCVVYQYESCDSEGENCSDRFGAELRRDGRELVDRESMNYADIAVARGRCLQLAAYGIRPQEGP